MFSHTNDEIFDFAALAAATSLQTLTGVHIAPENQSSWRRYESFGGGATPRNRRKKRGVNAHSHQERLRPSTLVDGRRRSSTPIWNTY